MLVKIAARQSDLARLQAFEVGRALQKSNPGIKVEYSFRSSLGDQRADDPLWKMPEKGVFTEDFVNDIMAGKVDLVVHSWKDLPIMDRAGTQIVATLARADARDVLLVRRDRWRKVWSQPEGAQKTFRVLTSSPRRVHNLGPFLAWALPWTSRGVSVPPKIEFAPVRGNIATRIGKLVSIEFDQSCDALVVAKAALDRLLTSAKYGEPFIESQRVLRAAMDLVDFVVLPLSINPAAAAQGALAIEVRSDRKDLIELCKKIDSPLDRSDVEAERRELAKHGGGCHQKIGVTVLNRPYGQVQFIRGVTDAGLVLDSVGLKSATLSTSIWPRATSPAEISTGAMKVTSRTPIEESLPSGSFYVARAEAWPAHLKRPPESLVWTAGLQTWRKLASRGIWVNGSSESLGEVEATRVEVLKGEPIEWIRLTHSASDTSSDALEAAESMRSFATYRIEIAPPLREELSQARFFFWRSGSQFRAALEACPEIAQGFHGTGPGQTHRAVQEGLAAAGVSIEDVRARVRVFLNEEGFLKAVRES